MERNRKIQTTRASILFLGEELEEHEQGMIIMGDYARRNMEDIDAIRRHTSQLEDGTAGIAYQMGLLGLAPSEQFNGGAFQQYYDQGYNARGNQEG